MFLCVREKERDENVNKTINIHFKATCLLTKQKKSIPAECPLMKNIPILTIQSSVLVLKQFLLLFFSAQRHDIDTSSRSKHDFHRVHVLGNFGSPKLVAKLLGNCREWRKKLHQGVL